MRTHLGRKTAMPNSFSRFLSEEDLAKVRQQYLAELEKTTSAAAEPADERATEPTDEDKE
jgi:hypothetical protein